MELIIGSAISLFIQWLKKSAGLTEYSVLSLLILICLSASAVYTYMVYAGLWETFYTILTTAGAFYAFVIQRFKTDESK